MIRMGWMTDRTRVIGSTWTLVNTWRIMWMPKALKSVMEDDIYSADYFAAGPMMAGFAAGRAKEVHLFSRKENFVAPAPNVFQCSDPDALAARFATSEEDLLAIGGITVFNLLLPFATRLHIAETDSTYPGNVVFDAWEKAPGFSIVSEVPWNGGRTLTYERSADHIELPKGHTS